MRKIIAAVFIVVILVGGLSVWQLTESKKVVAPAIHNNPQVLPVASNPIHNTSQLPGLIVKSAAAEDNTDPLSKQAISDRLQVTLQNTSSQTMSNFEIYYTMKDSKTGQAESYYQKLTGLELAPNEVRTIAFDNEPGPGHYLENKYSLYRSSQNQVDFSIQVSAMGFKPALATAKKSAGTGETAG